MKKKNDEIKEKSAFKPELQCYNMEYNDTIIIICALQIRGILKDIIRIRRTNVWKNIWEQRT